MTADPLGRGEPPWIHCAGEQVYLSIACLPLAPSGGGQPLLQLQDPKHKPPALRRGLFNSRNSFSFPLEQWRMMLPCCCRQAWPSTCLFPNDGQPLPPQICPPHLLLAPPQAGQGLTPGSWTSFAGLGPSPSFLPPPLALKRGGKRDRARLPAQPLLPPWASKALAPPSQQVPACPPTLLTGHSKMRIHG